MIFAKFLYEQIVSVFLFLLGDVATIQLGPEMRRGISELNGQGETVGVS